MKLRTLVFRALPALLIGSLALVLSSSTITADNHDAYFQKRCDDAWSKAPAKWSCSLAAREGGRAWGKAHSIYAGINHRQQLICDVWTECVYEKVGFTTTWKTSNYKGEDWNVARLHHCRITSNKTMRLWPNGCSCAGCEPGK